MDDYDIKALLRHTPEGLKAQAIQDLGNKAGADYMSLWMDSRFTLGTKQDRRINEAVMKFRDEIHQIANDEARALIAKYA